MEILAWIGSISFTISALPQLVQVIYDKHARGLNWFFLLLWWLGCFTMGIYFIGEGTISLISNYLIQLVAVTTIVYYKIRGG